ncbi:uncharacterized protein K460DRAFT_81717 [Cucurbitaria berberidis CBS 394.84]|uniref:RING-type domain-containing protein n=1 Tax=Cucurbitaria berberidis CBS 394.84 TaxID=1168544 RepID=A0A9P4GM09_9PLEO|nr:uncharacterized protein K460DRAFT_81717 [Cucurbitaria berberidis CBS 394.84]KAF1848853.1 hypothetical protein K460DRAFT_81717 [Cucurbitaria berberidis CBS 394.84]
MSSYANFSELANAIHGAPSDEVISSFKAIARIVVLAHQIKKNESEDLGDTEIVARLRRETKQQMLEWQQIRYWDNSIAEDSRLRPHLLSQLDAASIFDIIYANIDKIVGDPKETMFFQGHEGVTVAEHFVVKCVIHPDSDPEGELRRLWSPYLVEQPDYEPTEELEERYERQVRQAEEEESSTCFPSLVETLRSFISAEYFDDAAVFVVLQEYLSLGATAVGMWTHIWQVHGIRRGQALADDDHHLEFALDEIEAFFSYRIGNWQDKRPLHVRRELAQHNFSGDFIFLVNHVFPSVIAPAGSYIRESMFGWEMYQYIVNAATTPEIDPGGLIAGLIQQRLCPAAEAPNASRLFYRHPSIGVFVSFENSNEELDDVELEAYGPEIEVGDVSKQVPPGHTICTICHDGFGSEAEEKSPCMQLLACKHLFHCVCLGKLVNGVHVDHVPCPNCRAKICRARSLRRIEEYYTLDSFEILYNS